MLHCALADAIIGIQTENYWLQVYALSENRKKQNVPNSSFYNNSWDQLKYELEGSNAFKRYTYRKWPQKSKTHINASVMKYLVVIHRNSVKIKYMYKDVSNDVSKDVSKTK